MSRRMNRCACHDDSADANVSMACLAPATHIVTDRQTGKVIDACERHALALLMDGTRYRLTFRIVMR